MINKGLLFDFVLNNIKTAEKYNMLGENSPRNLTMMMYDELKLQFNDTVNEMEPKLFVEFVYTLFACAVQASQILKGNTLSESLDQMNHYKKVVNLFETLHNINGNTKNETN